MTYIDNIQEDQQKDNYKKEGQKETGRIEAFSDGVYAIAITLLVLDLHLPADSLTSSNEALLNSLLALWPTFFAFSTSFATIGIMWINHHRLFTHISKSDNTLLGLNLLLLFGVTIVPFPTSLIASHFNHEGEKTATLFYSALCIMIAVFYNVLWRYAVAKNLIDNLADQEAVKRISRQYLFGPFLYLTTFFLVFISAKLSLAGVLLLALFFALPGIRVFTRNESADNAK